MIFSLQTANSTLTDQIDHLYKINSLKINDFHLIFLWRIIDKKKKTRNFQE